jgi:hypothetical protein
MAALLEDDRIGFQLYQGTLKQLYAARADLAYARGSVGRDDDL